MMFMMSMMLMIMMFERIGKLLASLNVLVKYIVESLKRYTWDAVKLSL